MYNATLRSAEHTMRARCTRLGGKWIICFCWERLRELSAARHVHPIEARGSELIQLQHTRNKCSTSANGKQLKSVPPRRYSHRY